ncbi:MAG: type IV secretion system DNA-binding domain-containing protein [Candidatus Sungbacteria bacterium]|nr:type IV secretion system DNA-binding domain-containing protein [Candidatus Sungbacteria bacterium]
MSDLLSFLFVFGLLSTALIAAAVFVLRAALLRRGLVVRSLNLELLAVRFRLEPGPEEKEKAIQQIREKIGLMEQFYVNLHAIRDSFWNEFLYGKPAAVFEMTIPHIGEELAFYIAVPRRVAGAVEKILQGIFPEAQVEASRDYNMFNPEGATVASRIVLKKNQFYPIRTYQKLETDPMKELTNVFTKLAVEGEGAALQIIVRPSHPKWQKKLKEHSRKLFEGKPVSTDPVLRAVEIVGEIFGFSSAPKEKEEKEKKEQERKRLTPLQEELVKSLESKAGKALFEVNIRVIASAPDLPRAESILQGLELPFEQFADPNANQFVRNRLSGKSLRNLLFLFSFRSFQDSGAVVLSTEELTSVFHFPNVVIETPKIGAVRARQSSPPPNLPREGLLLGYNVFRGQESPISMMDEDRRRHLYIIGQTGTGKSVFLENMLVQDIQAGKGVCMIDPHGDLAERVLAHIPRHRWQDLIYFNPGDVERPMGLNMLEYDARFPEQKTFVVNELLSIFKKLYGAVPESMGPAFEQYFRNSTLLVMDHPESGNTLMEVSRVLSNKSYRDMKLSHTTNPVVRQFWENAEKTSGEQSIANFVPYITNKFDNFIANEIMRPIVAQERSAFSFRDIMDNGKILLVNLSKGRLGDLNSALIGLIIVGKLLISALSRVDIGEEKRKDFYLYIDEVQNVTTDSIAVILSEARKYRLDLIITHQFIGQLAEEIKKAVFGNVGSMVAFRIGADDAEFMAKQFKPVFSEQDLLNIDNRNCYVKLLINGQTTQPFNMRTYAPKKGDASVTETVKEISRLKYGRPREEVEQEILARFREFDRAPG